MKKLIIPTACGLLVLLFSYTAVSKLIDIDGFAFDMHNQPFPRWFSSILIWMLPAAELAIAGMLLAERTRMAGLWSAALLMLLFTIYTVLVLLKFYYKVPCSCGGVIKHLNWRQHLVLNLFVLGLTTAAIVTDEPKNIHA